MIIPFNTYWVTKQNTLQIHRMFPGSFIIVLPVWTLKEQLPTASVFISALGSAWELAAAQTAEVIIIWLKRHSNVSSSFVFYKAMDSRFCPYSIYL